MKRAKVVFLMIGLMGALACRVDAAAEFVLFDRELSILQDLWLPADPSPSQRYAAEEYVAYMKRMTDRTVTVRQVPKTGKAGRPYKRGIVSITTASPADNLGDDGFIVRISNDGLEIRGSRVRGCLYGVYEVLERFGGCRWYSSWCEKVPRPARIAVPMDLNLVERPAFEMRQPHWYDYIIHPLFAARVRANGRNTTDIEAPDCIGGDTFRFGGGLRSCHTFGPLMPSGDYLKEHPEYYSLVKGERKPSQLCLSNPDVLRIVTEEVLRRIRADPGARFYGVSQNDIQEYCTCERCAAIDAEEGSPAGSVVRFVNAVAEAVEKEFPDVKIETLAYDYSRRPPKKARLRHNVVPCLCSYECDMGHPLVSGTFKENVAFRDDIVKWGKQAKELYVWDYATVFCRFPLVCPNVHSIGPNIRFFRDNNVRELFIQGDHKGHHAHLAELKGYLQAKLMWNPDQDANALIADFTDGFYGAAAPMVRADLEDMEKSFLAGTAVLKCGGWQSGLPADFFVRSRVRWEDALAAVRDDPERTYNVRAGLFALDYTLLTQLQDLKGEDKWSDAERDYARLLARRLLGFLKDSRGPVQIGEWQANDDAKYSPVPVWQRLARGERAKTK